MFYVFPTPQAIGQYVSELLVKQIKTKPSSTLGLATGSTMLPVYANLIEKVQQENLDLSGLSTFNLDEYIGLVPTHEQSYHFFMQDNLFRHLSLQPEQSNLPNGTATDLDKECCQYSELLEDAQLDVQLLGVGTNGHIGFNEPYTPFDSRTHVVKLTENTLKDNSRFFADISEMPTHAITMGLADIMSAKEVILVATGKHKAEVMAELFHSPITDAMPASVLKQHHNVLILMDEEAASLIPEAALSRMSA